MNANLNDISRDQLHAVVAGTKIAYASDLGWPIGYWPLVIRVDGVFHKIAEKTPEGGTYRSVAGRTVLIFND